MKLARRTAPRALAGSLGLALVAGAVGVAAPAHAASWSTLATLEDAKLQACKVSADGGDAWRIKLRVRNGNDFWVSSSATVLKDGAATNRTWESGRVAAGRTSDVGSVLSGRSSRWTLTYSLGAAQLGGGGVTELGAIRGC